MADVYALDKGGGNRKLLTSHDDGVSITFGDGEPRLVQQANLSYQLRCDARFEVGSENLFWSTGQSQGTLQLNKLVSPVGGGGVLDGLGDLGERGGQARVTFNYNAAEGGGLTGDGVWSQIQGTMTVGDMSITDGGVMSLANVEKQ